MAMSPLQRRSQALRGAQISKSKEDTKKAHRSRKGSRIFGIAVGAFFLAVLHVSSRGNEVLRSYEIGDGDGIATSLVYDIETGVRVTAEFDLVNSKSTTITLGPHKATLSIPSECTSPGLWLRLEGDALVAVSLSEHETQWDGSFTLPIEGNYSLVAYWYGCEGSGKLIKRKVLLTLIANDSAMVDIPNRSSHSLFPPSAWMSAKKFQQAHEMEQPYVWHNPRVSAADAKVFKTSESFVTMDSATFPQTNFYDFKSLSNYELVCWVGGASAELLHRAFLNLRTHVSSHQRPFKFHIYNSTSFVTPDAGWTDATREKFRKCKHILVSMDPVKPALTQAEYILHIQNFIGHVVKAFPDDTFPIWIFTVLESPTKPTSCLEPHLPRTSDHPCNTALKELFRNSPFPERVRFLDNTDVTLPQWDGRPNDMATAIALRIFVFVGKQVAAWRAKGQVGNINGLQRGDHLEPNFNLVPYVDWGK